MDCDPYASDEDSDSRKDSRDGESPGSKDRLNERDGEGISSKLQAPVASLDSPSETIEDGIVLLLPGPSCPLNNGFTDLNTIQYNTMRNVIILLRQF